MKPKNHIFHCKEFDVYQEKSAMKVGTDSLILGSWVDVSLADSILDIGTGTGILALMMAQRSEAEIIDAVEIEADAFEESVHNFEHSPWGDRLYSYHTSLQEFVAEISEKYDLIVCNPPYFAPSNIHSTEKRPIARQTHLLNHLTLLKNTKKLLSKNGTCSFSIPTISEEFFVSLAQSFGFELQRILRTKDTANANFTRSFLQFGWVEKKLVSEHLVLKDANQNYTPAYKKLTGAFYNVF